MSILFQRRTVSMFPIIAPTERWPMAGLSSEVPEAHLRLTTSRVERHMLLWSHPMTNAEICCFNLSRTQYSFDRRVIIEWKSRSLRGFLIPYRHVEVNHLPIEPVNTRYVAIPSCSRPVKFLGGFSSDPPPSLYCIGSKLINNPQWENMSLVAAE